MYIYIYILYNDALVKYFDFHPINRRMISTDKKWNAGSTASEYSKRYQPWSSVVGKWLENGWFFLDFDDFQMVLKRENIWSSKTNHQGVRKKSSAMFSPIRNTKNLDIKSETCLFRRGLERGWCSPRWSQVIPRNFWETAPEKWKPMSEICGNMLKQLDFFFLRCTLDMTQHRTDWWNASNFHTSPFHRQSINFLEPMLPVMLQAFFAMFSYRNMLHVAVCCPFPGSRSRRKDQWINQQQCSSIGRGNDFVLYVARKQPKNTTVKFWQWISVSHPISGHISDSVTCQGNP